MAVFVDLGASARPNSKPSQNIAQVGSTELGSFCHSAYLLSSNSELARAEIEKLIQAVERREIGKSGRDGVENGPSIDVALISLIGFHLLDVFDGFFFGLSTVIVDGFVKRFVNIASHVDGIAANIKMRAAVDPVPYFFGSFVDFILHVDFEILISRPSEVEPVQ